MSWNTHLLPLSYGILPSTLESALHLFGYRESDGAILDTSIGFPSIRPSAKDHIRLECSTSVVRRLSHRACFVSTRCSTYSPTIHSETETEAENQAKCPEPQLAIEPSSHRMFCRSRARMVKSSRDIWSAYIKRTQAAHYLVWYVVSHRIRQAR